MKRLRIFTWHVHGNYLYYLSHAKCDFILPVKENHEEGYVGKTQNFPWGNNVHEVPVHKIKYINFDCILFQSKKNYITDQYEIFSEKQRILPKIYLEHDPPRPHPTNTKHITYNQPILVVHVTHFNKLMWNCGNSPTEVIEHGVTVPQTAEYNGRIEKGLVIINNISKRGRRLGLDIYKFVRSSIPLEIIGMNSQKISGIGEIQMRDFPDFISNYRFLFSPIRYTSLGLSICEAMMVGLPVIGLATTELVTVIENGKNGFIDTSVETLVQKMVLLLKDTQLAHTLSRNSRETAKKRFSIDRFTKEWEKVFLTTVYTNIHQYAKQFQKETFAKVV